VNHFGALGYVPSVTFLFRVRSVCHVFICHLGYVPSVTFLFVTFLFVTFLLLAAQQASKTFVDSRFAKWLRGNISGLNQFSMSDSAI
jgi:hypothetical protein